MPLTKVGQKILRNMMREYGASKGKHVFYAMENAGSLTRKAIKRRKRRKRRR